MTELPSCAPCSSSTRHGRNSTDGAREPDAFAEQWSGVFVGETLSFGFTTSAGEDTKGSVGIEPNGVAVQDSTAPDAAEFVPWLREDVFPEKAGLEANITEGVDWQLPQISLPRTAPAELATILTVRVEEMLRYEEQQFD